MQRNYSLIRDLKIIEDSLNTSTAGVAAFHVEDRIVQYPTSYIYIDKNIYILFREGEEYFDLINYGSKASFNILLQNKKKKSKTDSENGSKYISISIHGSIKKLDEQAQIEKCLSAFLKKYANERLSKNVLKNPALNQIIMIDSEEIQAFEETIS